MKNQNWSSQEDAVCVLVMQRYEQFIENAKHGTKMAAKSAFCEVLMGMSTLYNHRKVDGLRQHMDYLSRILKGKINWSEVRPEYQYLHDLWSAGDVDLNTVTMLMNRP